MSRIGLRAAPDELTPLEPAAYRTRDLFLNSLFAAGRLRREPCSRLAGEIS